MIPLSTLSPIAGHSDPATLATLDRDKLLELLLELRTDWNRKHALVVEYGLAHAVLTRKLMEIRAAVREVDT